MSDVQDPKSLSINEARKSVTVTVTGGNQDSVTLVMGIVATTLGNYRAQIFGDPATNSAATAFFKSTDVTLEEVPVIVEHECFSAPANEMNESFYLTNDEVLKELKTAVSDIIPHMTFQDNVVPVFEDVFPIRLAKNIYVWDKHNVRTAIAKVVAEIKLSHDKLMSALKSLGRAD